MTRVMRVRSLAVFATAARSTITPAAPATRGSADDACPWVHQTCRKSLHDEVPDFSARGDVARRQKRHPVRHLAIERLRYHQ